MQHVRVGTIHHDGTHLSLDDDNVRAQVRAFMEKTLAAMIASGEAERLAEQEDAARVRALAAIEAGQRDGSYQACIYPALEKRAYDAFDLDQDDWTLWRVSLMAEDVADTYLHTRQQHAALAGLREADGIPEVFYKAFEQDAYGG